MKQREDDAFLIAESNSAIFVPVTLIETVLAEQREPSQSAFLKSNIAYHGSSTVDERLHQPSTESGKLNKLLWRIKENTSAALSKSF